MTLTLALVLVWAAAGYRVWITLRRPHTVWRSAFTAGMICSALAVTLWTFRGFIDRALGLWNLTNLLSHVIFTVGIGFVLIYLAALRSPDIPRRRVAAHLLGATLLIVAMTWAWVLAPIHDRFYPDMVPIADQPAVLVYNVSFYIYVSYGLAGTAHLCFSRGRAIRRADISRSVSLMMSGAASVAALIVLALWTTSLVIHPIIGSDAFRFSHVGTALLPVPILLLATGVLILLAMPWVISVVTTAGRWARLRPLWRDLIDRYPQIHLEMPITGGPLRRLQIQEARALIEIHDALRVARLDIDDPPNTAAVARALRARREGQRCPADALGVADTRDADLEQMLALARAWEAAA